MSLREQCAVMHVCMPWPIMSNFDVRNSLCMQVMLEAPTLKLGDGQEKPQQSKSYPTQRKFEVLYLDEQIKIIRYLPDEADKERVLFVQRRVPEEVPEVDMPAVAEEDADLEDQEQIAEAVPA